MSGGGPTTRGSNFRQCTSSFRKSFRKNILKYVKVEKNVALHGRKTIPFPAIVALGPKTLKFVDVWLCHATSFGKARQIPTEISLLEEVFDGFSLCCRDYCGENIPPFPDRRGNHKQSPQQHSGYQGGVEAGERSTHET